MPLDWWSARDLAAKALANGGVQLSPMRIAWDISGDCQSPFTYPHYAAPPAKAKDGYVTVQRGTKHSILVEITTRCRNCLRARAALWRMRSAAEIRAAPRTWFGTLTLSPDNQRYFRAKAQLSVKGRQTFEMLSESEQFRAVVSAIGPEITKWLKRLRKQAGPNSIRYCVVAEAHKSGDPHFHCLIHERVEGAVRHRLLQEQWRLGFSAFKLCEGAQAASYLSKYLSKSLLARVRASRRYGEGFEETGFRSNIIESYAFVTTLTHKKSETF